MKEVQTPRYLDRFPVFTGGHPFLGFSGDWSVVFPYLPRDVSNYGASLRSFSQDGFTPSEGDKLNLCLPFRMNEEFLDQCLVRWVRKEEEGWTCGGPLTHRAPLRYPFFLDSVHAVPLLNGKNFTAEAALKLIADLLRDAWLGKRCIAIYFQHIAPFFTRSAKRGFNKHKELEARLFRNIAQQIEQNISALEDLRGQLNLANKPSVLCQSEAFIRTYRSSILSEILLEPLTASFSAEIINRYLHSIRVCEHKLALNYNTFLLLQYWLVDPS